MYVVKMEMRRDVGAMTSSKQSSWFVSESRSLTACQGIFRLDVLSTSGTDLLKPCDDSLGK